MRITLTAKTTQRRLYWALLGVLVAVYAGVMLSPLAAMPRFLTLEALYCVPVALTVVLSWKADRQRNPTERRFWALLGAANAFLLACELLLIYWIFAIDPVGPPKVSWPFHLLHAGAATCLIALVFSMSRFTEGQSVTKARIAVDIALLALIVYLVMLAGYARPVMGTAPLAHVLLGAAYPMTGALMLLGTGFNVLTVKVMRWPSWERLVAVSLPVYALAISLWPWWYTTVVDTSRNVSRGWLDLVQMAAHWTLMMAVVYRLSGSPTWQMRLQPPISAARHRSMVLTAPFAAVAAVPVAAFASFSARQDGAWFTVFGAIAVLIALLAVAHSALVVLENSTLFHRSVTDPLTGMYNHRFFHDRLSEEVKRAKRWTEEVSVIFIDIDDFSLLNERLGHTAGDRLLASLGAKLTEACGPNDVAARLGGDKFGIVAPEMDGRSASVLAQRLLDVLSIEGGARPGEMTASAGIASFPGEASTAEELLQLADGALFRAKELGKNRAVLFEPGRVPDLSAKQRIERLERQARLASVRALAAAVDARDSATQDHSVKVAGLAGLLCSEMGLENHHAGLVELAALVHDVGKIGLPDHILRKPQPLTDTEWSLVREHPAMGQQVLASTDLKELLPWVRGHHERWDGTGYPDGLAGEEIPLEARILSVCDAYDAMTSNRPYRSALSRESALAELQANSGTQFAPDVVDAFVRITRPSELISA